MTELSKEVLDKTVNLELCEWEGRIHCAYFNDFRIAGGKPWGGGTIVRKWKVSIRDLIRAVPDLQDALDFNALGNPNTPKATP